MHYEIRYHRKSAKRNVFYAVDTPKDVHETRKEIHPRMNHPRATLDRMERICRHVRSRASRELFCIYESITTKLSLTCVWGIEPTRYTIMLWNARNDTHIYDDVIRDVLAYDRDMLENALSIYAPQLKDWPWRRPAPPYPKWEITSPRSGKAVVELQDHVGLNERPNIVEPQTLQLWQTSVKCHERRNHRDC